MPEVKIRPGEADQESIPQTVGWERKQEVGKMRRLLIDVERSKAESKTLNRKSDAIELVGEDTVRLVDIDKGGATWTLVCYSMEWDANRAGFTDGGKLYTGTDAEILKTLVGEVPDWSEGTINTLTGDLSFVFNHSLRSEAVRRLEKNTPGEIKFDNEGTLNYTDRLGSDRSADVELSSAAGTIEQEINITERGRELDGTHIRVLGTHEGEGQLFANLIPSDDTNAQNNHDNVVTYSTSRWTEEADTDWDRWVNKDVTDQATLDEEAAALGEELKETLVEAEAVVTGVDLTIGDTVQVVKDDANLDRAMRVHRLIERAGQRNDTGASVGTVQKVLLSTRTTLRGDETQELRDIQRFNSGFQGSSVVIQGGGSRQPVNASLNAKIPFNYPSIAFENVAELHVRGLPYRAYSSGAASGGGATVTSADNADLTNIAGSKSNLTTRTTGSGFTILDSFTVGSLTDVSALYFHIEFFNINNELDSIPHVELRDTTSGNVYPTDSGPPINIGDDASATFTVTAQENVAGHDFDIAVDTTGSGDKATNFSWWYQTAGQHTHDVTLPDHTHPADAGITEFSTETPSGVDVIIGGTEVATNIGSGEFETVVDISGDLTKDSWNTIELTSDDLGHIQATVSIQGYKQIGAN